MPNLPYRPEVPTAQTLRWRTDIMKAYDGTEHRMALLTKPRQALNYKILLEDDEVRQLRADMFNDLETLWKVPLWHEPYEITADVAIGAGSVTGDFPNNDISGDTLVEWGNLINVVAADGTLVKTGGGAAWNGTAQSGVVVPDSADGRLTATFVEDGTFRTFALAASQATALGGMNFAIQTFPANVWTVRELDVQKATGAYAEGDTFRIMRNNGAITYWKNGALIWTSAITNSTDPLYAVANLYTVGGTLTGARTGYGPPANVYAYFDLEDGTTGEFVEVWAITDGQLFIDGVTVGAFPAGSYVYPVAIGYMEDGQGYVRQAVELTELTLAFTDSEAKALGGSGATVTTYEGLPLLDRRPLANSAVAEDFTKNIERIDFGATLSQVTGMDFANISGQRRFVVGDRDELQFYKLWLDTVLGMCEPFYCPTWRADLVLYVQPTPSASTIRVVDTPSYLTEWDPSDGHRDLQLETTAGTIQRRVAGVVDNLDGTLTITFTSALPGATWTVSVVSFVERCRLSSDAVTFTHHGQFSVVDMAITTIEEPVPLDVVWTSIVNCTATLNDLENTGGGGAAYDAGAVSSRQVTSGNCYCEFTTGENNKDKFCGLSNGDADTTFADIDFAFYMAAGTMLSIYEAGVFKGLFGGFSAGDLFRVQIVSGEVTYWRNGVLVYTSLNSPTYPILVDTAMQGTNATINDAVIGEI